MQVRPKIQPHEVDYGHTPNIKIIQIALDNYEPDKITKGEQELSDWLETGYWEILKIDFSQPSVGHWASCFIILKRKGY